MAFRKKGYKPRYRRTRKFTRRSKTSYAKKAYKIAKTLQRNVEHKTFNIQWSESKNITSGDQVYHISQIGTGTSAVTRDGWKISIDDCKIRLTLGLDGTFMNGDYTPQYVRIILLQSYQQQSDTNIDTTKLFLNSNFNSPYNYPAYKRLFKVYMDKVYHVGPYNCNGEPGTIVSTYYSFWGLVFRSLFIRPGPRMRQVLFNGDSGSDIQKNGLYAIARFATGQATRIILDCQLTYSDI